MKPILRVVVISLAIFYVVSCTEVGVGGTVNGGSNGNVSVGAGVNIHLYTEQNK